jgi:hypothetical protein
VRICDITATLRRAAAVLATLCACLAGFGAAAAAAAHEIPTDVKVNAFVRPAGNRLELLIRVPMLALQDVDFPRRGPGYLDLPRAEEALRGATKMWIIDNIDIYENGALLPAPRIVQVRVSLPSDRSFVSYEAALAHVQGPPLAGDLELYWDQQLLDVLLEYPITSDQSEFSIHPRVDRYAMRTTTALRFMPPGGVTRAFEFHGDPGLVYLDPRWFQAARSFVVEGFWHILGGTDHLLFLVCLVVPFRRLRPLVIIVTSFTVAHSISLFSSALNFVPDALWFPPLVETLIAVTIVYMALENIVYAAQDKSAGRGIPRRWIFAFAFGIVHGFGFSFALRETLQFAGDHLLTSLLAFNIGVEIGQLAVLIVLIPAVGLLFRFVVAEWLGIIILSALVTHTAWHWLIERWEQLAKFPFPSIDAAFLASAMRGLMAALILAGCVSLANGLLKRWLAADALAPARDAAE